MLRFNIGDPEIERERERLWVLDNGAVIDYNDSDAALSYER